MEKNILESNILILFIDRFKNNKKNGFGELHYPDGKKFIGFWKNDLENGEG